MALFAHSRDAFLLGRTNGPGVDANPAAVAMLGYSAAELRRLGPDAALDPGDLRTPAAIAVRRRTGYFQGLLACRRKDGEVFDAEVWTTRFADAPGRERIGTLIRRPAEGASAGSARGGPLEASGADASNAPVVLDHLPAAVFVVHADGRVEFNPAAVDLLGMPPDRAGTVSAYSSRILYPDGTPVPPQALVSARVLRDGVAVAAEEFLVERPDGRRIRIIGSARPIRDAAGRVVAAVGVCQDVGDRAEAERLLRASERLLGSTFELLPVGVWISDRQGKLVRANPAALRIWGGARWVGPEQFSQYRAWWADTGRRVEPDEWAMVRALRTGETSIGERVRIETFDGQTRTILNSAIPLLDDRGGIEGAVAVNEDITELKETEAALQRAIEWREQVLGIVAHDLRSPLHSLLLHLRLLMRIGERRADQNRTLTEMLRRATQMSRLVEDLLDVSRLESGSLGIEPVTVDARELLDRAWQEFEPLATEAGVTLRKAVGDGPSMVAADSDRILQVFDNLIGNALKFTAAGGTVTIGFERVDGEVVFGVKDSGPGMFREDLDRMFDRLWQAKPDGRGAGLGLGIARMIVEAHGGRIWAESAPGVGTMVRFALPAASGAT